MCRMLVYRHSVRQTRHFINHLRSAEKVNYTISHMIKQMAQQQERSDVHIVSFNTSSG